MTNEELKIYKREYAKKWRAQNPDKVNEYRKNTMRHRYEKDYNSNNTTESLEQYIKRKESAYRRAYYANNADRILLNRGRQYVNFIIKHGCEIWTSEQRAEILQELKQALSN